MKIKQCLNCGETFEANTSGKYCSEKCAKEYTKIWYKNHLIEKICKYCGETFLGTSKQVKCESCTKEYNWKKTKKKIICPRCGLTLAVVERVTTNKKTYFIKSGQVCDDCKQESRQLLSEARRGENNPNWISDRSLIKPNWTERVSDEQKLINRQIMSERMKGENNPMKNPETRKKVSDTIKEKVESGELIYKKGKASGNWKGNRIRSQTIRSRLYKLWVLPKLIRDNFTCQECGSKSNLEVHHLTPFDKVLAKVLNGRKLSEISYEDFEIVSDEVIYEHAFVEGITVCKSCHKKIDKRRN